MVSVEARRYREHVAIQCKLARVRMLTEPVVVSITGRRARKSGDLDGRLKILLDALQGHAFENDSQVVATHAFRLDDREHPGVTVTVEAAA